MVQADERRRHPRYTVRARLACDGRRGTSFFDLDLRDISLGGVCIETSYPLAQNETIHLLLPLGKDSVYLKGQVVQIEPMNAAATDISRKRVRVKFRHLTFGAWCRIQQFVEGIALEWILQDLAVTTDASLEGN
jgi:hypothetical protein